MGYALPGFMKQIGLSRPFRAWEKAMQRPRTLLTRDLRAMLQQMQGTRHRIDHLAAEAQSELLKRVSASDGIARPDQCDWAERPAPWRVGLRPRGQVEVVSPLQMGEGLKLFHDAAAADLSVRQDPVQGDLVGPQFALVFEVYRFDGSFLSLVHDLPDEALRGLTLSHFIAIQMRVEREQPLEIYARLNVQHGPNQEQLVRQFDFDGDQGLAEFDLAYTKINEKRLEKAWIDLIFEGPEMNRIAIRDLAILRAPRADF